MTRQDKIEGKEKTLCKERVCNYQMRDKFGVTLMDRYLIDSLEVSDLYSNNDKSLIHVKLELQEHLQNVFINLKEELMNISIKQKK